MTEIVIWPGGRMLTRAHPHLFGSSEFDARGPTDADNRFSPLVIGGEIVPVAYAGTHDRTAAAETIFHTLPTGDRPRRLSLAAYLTWQWASIFIERDLRLLAVTGTDAAPLVDVDRRGYPTSRNRAVELLTQHDVDGLVWASAQLHDVPSSVAVTAESDNVTVMLVTSCEMRAGGVDRDEMASDGPAVGFATPPGLARLTEIATALDVTLVRP